MSRRLRTVVALLAAGCTVLAGCTSTPSTTDSTSSSSATAPSDTSPSAPSTSSSSSAEHPSTTTSGTTEVPATTAPAELTPVLAEVSTQPVPVTGTDGRVYLAYELYLTNVTSTAATINLVQAVDGDSGAVLQDRSGDELVATTRVVGEAPSSTPPSSVVLQGGQLGIVWLDPSVEAGDDVPIRLSHRITVSFASAPNPLVPQELTENVAATPVSDQTAPVIAPPLDGSNWFNGNGCCDEVTPHRGASNPINGRYWFAERFAIDWVQLDQDGRIFTGDATDLDSYAYYGAPIAAVADGTIVAVSDELQDQTPGSNPPEGSLTLDQYGGNYVVQEFSQDGDTYYAFYAHLKPGSAKSRLEVGQTVRVGEQLAELGNSGNTDAPHLHFHVMDGPDPLAGNGVPYEFSSLELVGRAAGDDAVETALEGERLSLDTDSPTGPRQDAMPLHLDLVDLTVAPTPTSAQGTSSSRPSTTGSTSGSPTFSTSVPTTSSASVPTTTGTTTPSATSTPPSEASITSSAT